MSQAGVESVKVTDRGFVARQRHGRSCRLELDPLDVNPSEAPDMHHLDTFPSLFAAGTLTGFDAAGHIAEETKNAR